MQTDTVPTGMAALIRAHLVAALTPEHLDVVDESAAHAGHSGHSGDSESHFRVRIVAGAFAGQTRVARHRQVNQAVAEAFSRGVHALAIEAAAPGEPVPWRYVGAPQVS